jgi:hypothetical protein
LSVAKVGGIEDPELPPIDPELLLVGVQLADPEPLPDAPESLSVLELLLGVCAVLLQAAGDTTATNAAKAR